MNQQTNLFEDGELISNAGYIESVAHGRAALIDTFRTPVGRSGSTITGWERNGDRS